jgi:hypothetical protein
LCVEPSIDCLKKIASILLLSLLLFNWIGYRLMTSFMQSQVTQALEAKIDRHEYQETDLVEMRVALNLPYQNDQAEFERVSGEIQIEGKHYTYVKRKIEKGVLVVMCIPNQTKTKIENSRDDYFKMVNDLQNGAEKKSEKSSSFKGFFNEYREVANNWSVAAPVIISPQPGDHPEFVVSFTADLLPGQPPEFMIS